MKRIVFALLFTVALLSLQAQTTNDRGVSERYSRLQRAYLQNPNGVANLVALAEFYADTTHRLCNLLQSYQYIQQAEKIYVALVEDNSRYREVKKLIRKKITITSVREQQKEIYTTMLSRLQGSVAMNEVELNQYAALFADDVTMQKAIEKRRMYAYFDQVRQINDLDALYSFQQKYPNTAESEHIDTLMGKVAAPIVADLTTTAEVEEFVARYPKSVSIARLANKQRSALAFQQANQQHTVAAYQSFLAQYPSSSEYVETLNLIEELLEQEYTTLRTPEEFADFITHHSENPLADDAMKHLHSFILDQHDTKATRIYLDRFPLDPLYNDIFRQFYDQHAAEGNGQPIDTFAHIYPNFPFQQAVAADLEVAKKVDAINLMDNFTESEFDLYSSHVYHLTGKRVSFVALQRTIQQLIAQQRWPGVLERIQFFELSFETDCVDEYAELQRIVSAPTNKALSLTSELSLGASIITAVPHPNGKQLYFTKSSGGRKSICMATITNDRGNCWKNSGELTFANNANTNLTLYSLYDNGSKMLVGYNGDICIAHHNDTAWLLEDPLPAPLNTHYIETDAVMTPDGSGMLLASDRPNGHNFQQSGAYFHGDTALASDLYFVPLVNGSWGEPINLGIAVNSAYSERCPVLSRNLKTLYFITDARGLGYGDVYVTTRTDVNDWQHWSTPVNMGKEVNSGFNEGYLALSANEKQMYLSSNRRDNRYACYHFNTQHNTTSNRVEVKVDLGKLGDEVQQVVLVESDQERVVEQFVAPQKEINLSLYKEHHYYIVTTANSGFVATLPVQKGKDAAPIALSLTTLVDMATPQPLPLVTFDPSGIKLTALAAVELDMVAAFLEHNPDAKVEIQTHVADADDSLAYALTYNRGEVLRNYLINRQIDPSRISIAAYGNINHKMGKPYTEVAVRFFTE